MHMLKKVVKKQIDNYSMESTDSQDKTMVDKLTNPVSTFDIEELVSNENAIMKLFQIAANGVYEDGGNRIRLTRKQRVALSNVLVQVSEKKMSVENTKGPARGNLNEKVTQGVEITNE